MTTPRPQPGWYSDPYGRADQRWFDGTHWSRFVVVDERRLPAQGARGGAPAAAQAATPAGSTATQGAAAAAATRLATVVDELDVLHDRGLLDDENHARARADLKRRIGIAHRATAVTRPPTVGASAPPHPTPTPTPTPTTTPTPTPTPTPTLTPAPAVAKVAAAPTPEPEPTWADDARAWLREAAASVRSDLAVHGLAYLGVLLFFAGVLGFVVFAFGDVAADLRPVAELVIPLALFGAAWFLQRRGSELVGAAIELLGGALLPIVLTASFVDGASVPPDARGTALAWTLAGAMAVVAGVYALITRRRAATPLRFLVAPVAWLSVTFAAATTNPDFTGGSSISRPGPWQMAITLAAIALTAVVVRARRGHPVADATDLIVLPGLAVVVFLGGLGAVRVGLTGGPLVLAGLAAFVVFAAQHERLGPAVTAFAQLGALVATLVGVGMVTTLATAGVTGTVVMLVFLEWQARRAPSLALFATTGTLLLAALALACTGTAAPALLATGAVFGWSHVRRARTPSWWAEPMSHDLVALVATVAFGAAVGGFLTPTVALVVDAAVLAVLTVVMTRTTTVDDATWGWWTPLLTVTVFGFGAASAGTVSEAVLAVVALVLTVPAVLGTRMLAVRVWLGATTLAGALLATGLALDASPATLAVVFALVGLALVLVTTGRTTGRTTAVWAHLHAVGLLTGIAAAGAAFQIDAMPRYASGRWWTVVPLAAAVAAWTATAILQETRGTALTTAMSEGLGERARRLAPFVAVVGWAATLVVAFHAATGDWFDNTALAVALLTLAAVTAAIVRRLSTSEPSAHAQAVTALVHAGTVCAFAAVVTVWVASEWAAAAAIVLVASALVLVVPAHRRSRTMREVAWLGTLASWMCLAEALGASDESQRGALFAWGAVAAVGALVADELRHGKRAAATWPRHFDWSALAVTGLVAMTAAWLFGADATSSTIGWWALVTAGVVLVLALLLRAPWVTLGTYGGLTAAVALLPAAGPPTDLWWIVLTMWGFLAAAVGLERLVPEVARADDTAPDGAADDAPVDPFASWPWRWDIPAWAAANALAVWVVIGAEQTQSPVALYLTTGVWALLAGAALLTRRTRATAGVAWLVAGAVLLEVGAGRAGPGWLTLALVLASVLTTVLGAWTRGPSRMIARRALQATGVATAWGAAAAFVWWTQPADSTVVIVGAVVAGLVVVAFATARRYGRVADDWALLWGTPAVATVLVAAAAAVQLVDVGAGVAAAVALALVAVAAAELAAPLSLPVLRDAVVLLGSAAIGVVLATTEAGPDAVAVVAGSVGFAATLAVAALVWRRPESVWTTPLLEAAGLAAVVTAGAGIAALPATDLLVAALALGGAEAAVLGLTLGRFEVLGASPVLLCAAWLLFAADALQGNPQWFTVPIGVTLLVVEGLVRAARRARGLDPHLPAIVAIDVVGMAFVVGASLVQIVTANAWYTLLAIAFGMAIVEWSIATKVLHRMWFGAGTIVAALVLAIALPLVEYVPKLEGAGLWITIAALGLAALIAAAFLEAGKRRAEAEFRHLRALTRAWER